MGSEMCIRDSEYIAKPSSNSGLSTSNEFRIDLITRINALCVGLGGQAKMLTERAKPSAPKPYSPIISKAGKPSKNVASKPSLKKVISSPAIASGREKLNELRTVQDKICPGELIPFKNGKPEIVCIGSSTGGPRALQQVLQDASGALNDIPVVLTQHMPVSYTHLTLPTICSV